MLYKHILILILTDYFRSTSEGMGRAGIFSTNFDDCPGSDKEAVITKKSLKYLSFYVQSRGNMFTARRRKYTYYQMNELAKDPDIDFSKKTMLYVGGFLDSPNFPLAINLGAVYSDLGYNIMLLDTNMFTTVDYPIASRFMRPVGKHAATMLAELTNLGLDPKKLEIVGLSLGGQTASFIAKNYRLLTGVNIARLTGLDPAGPCFRNLGPEDRIDESDADFVDIVDTNIDAYGMAAPVGHVNFYVNGGEYQPGDIYWLYCTVMCSHIRSYTLWLAALQHPKSFIAMQCDSVQQARDRNCYDRKPQVTNVLGLNTDQTKRGIFYLATDHSYPFYLGEKGLKRENDFVISNSKTINSPRLMKM
ncbi:lipase member H-like isoform X3 [Epargyreus clarus]|uniref:lipase member H-like isoform X3 n=1 Tax=Epargyreus clarus TaxID=520877 RepID=UPI003C2CC8D4